MKNEEHFKHVRLTEKIVFEIKKKENWSSKRFDFFSQKTNPKLVRIPYRSVSSLDCF